MKISELMERLGELQGSFGDIEVMALGTDRFNDGAMSPLIGIEVIKHREGLDVTCQIEGEFPE